VFYKIFVICMVAILMLSTTSFSLFKHFCGDNLVNISFEKVESCCQSEIESDKIVNPNLNFSEKGCCKNEATLKNLSLLDITNTVQISKSKAVFITAYNYNFTERFKSFFSKNYFKDFSLLHIVFNKQIQFQSFLI